MEVCAPAEDIASGILWRNCRLRPVFWAECPGGLSHEGMLRVLQAVAAFGVLKESAVQGGIDRAEVPDYYPAPQSTLTNG